MNASSPRRLLDDIADLLRLHVKKHGAEQPLGVLGVFHCRHPQFIHEVPLHNPGFVLVISGSKEVTADTRVQRYQAGQLLLFPAGATLALSNQPATGSDYLAIAMTFSPELLEEFVKRYATSLQLWEQKPLHVGQAGEEFLELIYQWLQVCQSGRATALIHRHRQEELLLSPAQSGLVGQFFLQQQASWRQKITSCLAMEVGRDWKMEEVASRFACSVATLRRRLEEEGCNFRQLLEDVRLTSGLSLLQETDWPVTRVAQTVGYESVSRFSERFKQRFGLSPQELRITRLTGVETDID